MPDNRNSLQVFRIVKDNLEKDVLNPRGLTLKSCGTKSLELTHDVSSSTGFWAKPQGISTKPPRWILQVHKTDTGHLSANFSQDLEGEEFAMARTVGYVNNRAGNCAITVFRVLPSIQTDIGGSWEFPKGWEFLLVLGFSDPLHAGTSGDPLTEFNSATQKINFGAAEAKREYKMSINALLTAAVDQDNWKGISYLDVAKAVKDLLGANLYLGTSDNDIAKLVSDVNQIFTIYKKSTEFSLEENTTLFGVDEDVYKQIESAINIGKRHIIFYGPPGTGKTTLAEFLASKISEEYNADGSYLMMTASSAWSMQDVVGGYQPLGDGKIGFIPGAILRNFDKPIVIDELNRCPIDRVLGPLFSILSGHSSVLPYRSKVEDPDSDFYMILPKGKQNLSRYEYAPSEAWSLICTLNTYDKTQLSQISYALSRRFAWIKVGIPKDLEGFVRNVLSKTSKSTLDESNISMIVSMWEEINKIREIGGAPIIDFIKVVLKLDQTSPVYTEGDNIFVRALLLAFRMCVLPLLDGISIEEAKRIVSGISAAWDLEDSFEAQLERDCLDFSG